MDSTNGDRARGTLRQFLRAGGSALRLLLMGVGGATVLFLALSRAEIAEVASGRFARVGDTVVRVKKPV